MVTVFRPRCSSSSSSSSVCHVQMNHLEESGEVERIDVACGSSTSNKLHDGSAESWTVPDCNRDTADEPSHVTHCDHCSSAICGICDISSGVDGVENVSVKKCMVDVACGSDVDAAMTPTMVDASCGPDDKTAVVDVGYSSEDVLQPSDGNMLPKDQFERHTIDLHCVQKKNTHSRFLLYLRGKCLYLHKIFRVCLRVIKYSADIRIKYSLLLVMSLWRHIYRFVNNMFHGTTIDDKNSVQ